MRDIALNIDTWDVLLDGRDQKIISGSEALAQRLRIKLGHICGEWYLDTSGGGNSLSSLEVKNVDVNLYTGIMRGVIERDHEIVKILAFLVEHDRKARKLYVSFEAESIYGIIKKTGIVI